MEKRIISSDLQLEDHEIESNIVLLYKAVFRRQKAWMLILFINKISEVKC